MKRKISVFLSLLIFIQAVFLCCKPFSFCVNAQEGQISAPCACLMETSTGQVIYEKDADSKRPPASVTKIMTLLLVFDALDCGKINLNDPVRTSEYAASMGGSQVYLEEGEIQSVDTLIKCVAVASANDACVCLAEHISGSEGEFVKRMNERARGLKMENTNFVNCCGLDADGHETSARDIALMSRELLVRYPKIHDYCCIWMEDMTHKTSKGDSAFTLTNTNKLIRQYPYATGLKTGFTSKAGFCLSASAKKDDIELVAVIMGAEDSKIRFKEAARLLKHGFSTCTLYEDKDRPPLPEIKITGGVKDTARLTYGRIFRFVDVKGRGAAKVTKKIRIKDEIPAPVKKGDIAGKVIYTIDNEEIGSVGILISENVKKASYLDCIRKAAAMFLL